MYNWVFTTSLLIFILGMGITPFLVRILLLSRQTFRISPFFRGTLQDLFVLLELYLLGCLLPGSLFLLIPLAYSYLLIDGYLYYRVRERLGLGYLSSMKQFRYFIDSARKLGLRKFLFFWGLTLVYNTALLFFIPKPIFSWTALFIFVGIGCLCVTRADWVWSNALFALQKGMFFPRRFSQKIGANPIPSKNEKSVFLSEGFPLLKRIVQFEGEKLFDVKVKEEEKPHLIFLFLESFSANDVGCLGNNHQATPHFDALAEEGVLFRRFYSNGVLTSHALLSGLYGVLPFYVSKAQKERGFAPGNMKKLNEQRLIGIPDLLKEKGYYSAYFDNTAIDYEGHGQFLKEHGFDTVISREEIERVIPQEAMSWGGHDQFLFSYFSDWLHQKERESVPTFSALFTLSNHHPWHLPPGYHGKEFSEVAHEDYRRYLKTLSYTDSCLGNFIAELKESGLAKKTILVIAGDHGQDFEEDSHVLRTLNEKNIHVPLLIWAPGRIGSPEKIDQVGSHVDLLPTVMDMLGLHEVCHALGSSLMRKRADASAYCYSYLKGFSLGKIREKLELDSEEAGQVFSFVHSLYENNRFAMAKTRNIDFSQECSVSDEQLIAALKASQLPHSVQLPYCLKVTKQGFEALACHAEELIELDLSGSMITDEVLHKILKRAKRLEVLRLACCHLLGASTHQSLQHHAKRLRHIEF